MDEIIIVDYDPRWPQLFEEEARLIRAALGDHLVIRIEHIGSTAIPNLAAKPIIDLLIGVRSLENAKQTAVPALEVLGYSYWRDNPDHDRLFLVKGLPPNGPRSHHVHMIEIGSELWERVLFRDYLRAHSDEARCYEQLKRRLAVQYQTDREAYTEAKTNYIQEVLSKAREAEMSAVIVEERPDSADAVQLIAELEATLEPLYPKTSRHGFSVEKLLSEAVAFFVTRRDGLPVGCGGVKLFGAEYGEVKRMYVRPQFRGLGLGKLMLTHLAGYAREHGVAVLRLETGIHQSEAIGLYERFGFQRIAAFGEYQTDPLCLYFEKRID